MGLKVNLCGVANADGYFFSDGRYIPEGESKQRLTFEGYNQSCGRIAYSKEGSAEASFVRVKVIDSATGEEIDVALEVDSLARRLLVQPDVIDSHSKDGKLAKYLISWSREVNQDCNRNKTLNDDIGCLVNIRFSDVVRLIEKRKKESWKLDRDFSSVAAAVICGREGDRQVLDVIHGVSNSSNADAICRVAIFAAFRLKQYSCVFVEGSSVVVGKSRKRLQVWKEATTGSGNIHYLFNCRLGRYVGAIKENREDRGFIEREFHVIRHVYESAKKKNMEVKGVAKRPCKVDLFRVEEDGTVVSKEGATGLLYHYYNRLDMERCIAKLRPIEEVDFTPLINRWIGSIVKGVRAFHMAGVVHKDIKGENFLMANNGSNDPKEWLRSVWDIGLSDSAFGIVVEEWLRSAEACTKLAVESDEDYQSRREKTVMEPCLSGSANFMQGLLLDDKGRFHVSDTSDIAVLRDLCSDRQYNQAAEVLYKMDIYALGATILWLLLKGDDLWVMCEKFKWMDVGDKKMLDEFVAYRIDNISSEDDYIVAQWFCDERGWGEEKISVYSSLAADIRKLYNKGVMEEELKEFIDSLKRGKTEHQAQMTRCRLDAINEAITKEQQTMLFQMLNRNYRDRPSIEEVYGCFVG